MADRFRTSFGTPNELSHQTHPTSSAAKAWLLTRLYRSRLTLIQKAVVEDALKKVDLRVAPSGKRWEWRDTAGSIHYVFALEVL